MAAPWQDGLAQEDRRPAHWAYQPVKEVRSPIESDTRPVDVFVRQKLRAARLKMAPQADRRTLIRRLSFDLHGLPPRPEEVERFVNDPDRMAYEKLVDRLLDSPHYGERYARHWLDIAHYADTHGFERDRRRDNAWRYRDYVIRAFNEGKAYDRFLREQIAGDVLRSDDHDAVVATGFLAAGPWDFVGHEETKSPLLRRSARALDLDDMATQVMTATVAMTVNCARCHDHKLDPITRREYYSLWSVFAGVKRGERNIGEKEVKRYEAEKSRLAAEHQSIVSAIGELEGRGIDLADIVGGGNGSGTGNLRQGIDARTAEEQTRNLGGLPDVKANQFVTSKSEFVEGVFIPDGENGKAKIPISSTGITVTGLPRTSRAGWDIIRNGPVASQYSNEIGGIDFTKGGHTLIGLHANAGITFDLDAIRNATRERGFRFTAVLGYFGAAGDYRADAWVFVDGRKVFESRGLKRAHGLQVIDVPLPEGARFLTLLSADGGGLTHLEIIDFSLDRTLSMVDGLGWLRRNQPHPEVLSLSSLRSQTRESREPAPTIL